MTTLKTQGGSVRGEPRIMEALQTAAEREMQSVANMVEVMGVPYCRFNHYPLVGVPHKTLLVVKPGHSPL